jgi:Spy/CpxP family protein refolding chaperone
MFMKRLILTGVLAAATLLAQGPGRGMGPMGGPMGEPPDAARSLDEITAYLGLSSEQVTKLKEIRTAEFEANKSVREQIRTKREALRTALSGTSPTANELGTLLLDIHNLQKQIDASDDTYREQAVALLTVDQKTKLAVLKAAEALRPSIQQALFLNLLERPEPAGMGLGPAADRVRARAARAFNR